MKPHFGLTSHVLTAQVLTSACCVLLASRAGAQPVDRTRPPAIVAPIVQAPVADIAAIGAKAPVAEVAVVGAKAPGADVSAIGVKTPGAGVMAITAKAPGANVAVVGLNSSAARMPILVEKLRAHSLTPQQAWEAGDLRVPDLIYFLDSLDRWGGFTWEIDLDLRRQMVALLVEHGQKQLEEPEKLSPAVRLWLADYYGSIGDKRVLTLSESILREQKEPKKGEDALTFQALERMAWFYRDQGQHEKGAETWLRIPTLIPDQGWWQSDALIEAARLYSQGGKQEKAQQLYAQAGRSSDDYHAGGAIVEGFGRELQRNPKQTEIQLLQIKKESTTPDARLAAHFLLALARYKAQDWKGFLLQAEEVLRDYEQIEEKPRRRAFAPLALKIEDAEKWAKLWLTQTVVAENPDLHFAFDGPFQQPVERRVFVNTAALTPLQVTVEGDKNRVQARLEESPWASELEETRQQHVVVVTITPGVAQVQAVIRVQRLEQPSKPLELALTVSTSRAITPNQ